MATTKAISAALKLVNGKKENLRKAFEDLQSHSSSLSSFTLTWSDLDSHFTSLQSSLEHKFKLLQTLESQKSQLPSSPKPSVEPATVPARPELIDFCKKMDGLGLRRYMVLRPKELSEIRSELNHALICAPDPALLVLDAMEGFFPPKRGFEMGAIRSCCLTLLELVMELKLEIRGEVREKANKVAVEWKKNLCLDGEIPTEELGFLELVAAYGLRDSFKMDEIIDCLVLVSKRWQAFMLCRVLDIAAPELIKRLINKGNQVLAVKFIFEFAMTDKFPPVPLLKEYLKGINDLVKEIRNSGKHNEADMKEKSALKSVIKCIEDYKLESEYPKDSLVDRIEKIDKEKEVKKRSAAAPAAKPQQQQSTSKRPRTNEQAGPATMTVAPKPTVPPIQQPQGSLPDQSAPYMSSPAVPNPAVGPFTAPTAGPFTAPTAGPYGWPRAPNGYPGNPTPNGSNLFPSEPQMPMGYPGNPTPNGSNLYPTEPRMPAGYHGAPTSYVGYALPHRFHPSNYSR